MRNVLSSLFAVPVLFAIRLAFATPQIAVSDSANLGPYGEAIQTELIPYLEKKYRALGAGWSRFVYGGSTGGWEAMAVQILYPDFFNGAYIACPDPIDFRAYTVIDLYKDRNAFTGDSFWKRTPRPAVRDRLGRTVATVEETNRRELVLGSHGRSGDQWDIWQAVYSPVGPDGYPAPIWDKRTGVIDHAVAAYWKQHYDLMDIVRRDWQRGLGPKLRGKLHIYVGTMDTYFLDGAVHLAEEFLSATSNQESAVRRRDRLRPGLRALLDGRSEPAERDLPPALSRDVRTEDRRADRKVRTPGCRSDQLAILIGMYGTACAASIAVTLSFDRSALSAESSFTRPAAVRRAGSARRHRC